MDVATIVEVKKRLRGLEAISNEKLLEAVAEIPGATLHTANIAQAAIRAVLEGVQRQLDLMLNEAFEEGR